MLGQTSFLVTFQLFWSIEASKLAAVISFYHWLPFSPYQACASYSVVAKAPAWLPYHRMVVYLPINDKVHQNSWRSIILSTQSRSAERGQSTGKEEPEATGHATWSLNFPPLLNQHMDCRFVYDDSPFIPGGNPSHTLPRDFDKLTLSIFPYHVTNPEPSIKGHPFPIAK